MRASTLLLLVALFLAGCDSVNVEQYRVARASRERPAKVKHALASVASQLSLEDRTATSRAADTLVFYIEPHVEHFAVELGARGSNGDLLIDLSAGFGPTPPKYREAERLLAAGLSEEFGTRAARVEHPDTIGHANQ